MAGGKMVVFGGSGVTGADGAKTVLVFDPRADRWTTIVRAGRVVAAATAVDTLLLAELDDGNHVSVAQVAMDGADLVRGPAPAIDEPVDRVGLTVEAGGAYLVVTDERPRTRVYAGALTDGLVPAGAWAQRKTGTEVVAPNQVATGYTGIATTPAPGLVLLAGMPDVTVLNPRTGHVLLAESTYRAAGACGISGAVVWTGSRLLAWGGQTCRPSGPAVTAEGVALDVHPPSDRI
jgi:hypothetical protein